MVGRNGAAPAAAIKAFRALRRLILESPEGRRIRASFVRLAQGNPLSQNEVRPVFEFPLALIDANTASCALIHTEKFTVDQLDLQNLVLTPMVDFLFIAFRSSDPRSPVCLGVPRNAPPSPQLVAIDDRARIARHIVENATLDQRVHARMAKQDQRRAVVVAACLARDLPPLSEQLADRQRRLGGGRAVRRQHRWEENA
jgi:hypothetical protein